MNNLNKKETIYMANKNYDTTVINVTLNWACFNIPNRKSNKFQVDCCNLSPEDINKLKDIGLGERIRVKDDKEDYGSFITVKSNIKLEEYRNDEQDLRWFKVTDVNRMPIDLNKVGNGTKALIKVEAVPYDNDFGKGIKADLKLVVITKLVEYAGGENHDDMYEAAGNLPEMTDEKTTEGSDDGWGDGDAVVE